MVPASIAISILASSLVDIVTFYRPCDSERIVDDAFSEELSKRINYNDDLSKFFNYAKVHLLPPQILS